MSKVLFVGIFFVGILPYLYASSGDRSPYYQNCVKKCLNTNCTEVESQSVFKVPARQERWAAMLRWSCRDECCYHCMWKTVEEFKYRGFITPKFHGKWPFHRFFGIQEPMAAFASLLNFASNYHMFSVLRRRWWGRDVPLVVFWHGFAVLCMNTWIWSTVFHSRDTFFTEFMDYAGAMLMVLAFFVASLVRVLYKWRLVCSAAVLMVLLYFIEHCRYLYSGQIDYEYNMSINICFGIMGSTVWAVWAFFHFITGRRYAARMVAFTTLSGAALGLELYDFPPLLGGWDAHALWHLSTAPMPLILCKFVMYDLEYLSKQPKTTVKLA